MNNLSSDAYATPELKSLVAGVSRVKIAPWLDDDHAGETGLVIRVFPRGVLAITLDSYSPDDVWLYELEQVVHLK